MLTMKEQDILLGNDMCGKVGFGFEHTYYNYILNYSETSDKGHSEGGGQTSLQWTI